MPRLKILAIEDSEWLLPEVSSLVRQDSESEIFNASDGLEALQKSEALQPDLILLDVGSLKLNVIEASKRLRSIAPRANLVFLSRESGSDLVRHAIEAALDGKRPEDPAETEELRSHHSAIVESSDDAIIAKSLSGVISSWNSGAQRMFGYTEAGAIGQPITLIIPPELRAEEDEILKRLRKGQRVEHYETRRVAKDGRLVDVSITVSPIRNAEGKIIGASKIARDITEKMRSEAALRESEERFRLAMNNVAAGLYTVDLQGRLTYINPAAEQMFGWKSEELLGRKMHEIAHYMHPDGTAYPARECKLRVIQEGAELRECEDAFIKKDGTFFPVVFSASPLKRDGQLVGAVIGFRDDTLRREAERSIRESEERFRLLANAAPAMIRMSDADGLCTYVNQGWLEFTGRPIEAELGNACLDAVHPDDREDVTGSIAKALERREPFRMEYRLRSGNGEYRWVFDQGVPRFNADCSFAGYISAAIDVTDRKLAEEALSTVSQRLIEAQEEERHRIARELHDDITQQLSVLLLSLERLRLQSLKPEVREDLARAIKQASNIGRDVRALSHRLHSSNLKYLGLAEAVSGYCKEICAQHNVEVDLVVEDIPYDLPREISLCLFRVLQEALQNALKYSGTNQFQVSLVGTPDGIALTVQDSGVGFNPDEAFKTSGLGLTSMRERLKLVNGKVSIESQEGHGTRIHASVPFSSTAKAAS